MPPMLTPQDKSDIKEMIADGVLEVIQDVVMPAFETITNTMATKDELNIVKNRVEQIDRKLDHFAAKSLEHDGKLQLHDQKIKALEIKSAST